MDISIIGKDKLIELTFSISKKIIVLSGCTLKYFKPSATAIDIKTMGNIEDALYRFELSNLQTKSDHNSAVALYTIVNISTSISMFSIFN